LKSVVLPAFGLPARKILFTGAGADFSIMKFVVNLKNSVPAGQSGVLAESPVHRQAADASCQSRTSTIRPISGRNAI
jgi:hypothetical protein